jgi:catabolite regulation protein CreA
VISNNQLGSLEIKQRKTKNEEHLIKDAKAILFKENEMLAKYVDEVGSEGLDREFLLTIGQKICTITD